MNKYSGIDHIALATNDIDMTVRFWRDLLGMRLVGGLGKKGSRQYFLEIRPDMMISFFEWPDVEPVDDKDAGRPYKGKLSLDHICIRVEGEDALWALKDRLEDAGVWTSEVLDHGFIHSFFTVDPNHIQLEFCFKADSVSLSDSPKMVDKEPSDTAIEGPDPRPSEWPPVRNFTPVEERRIYNGELKQLFTRRNL